jgi:hypothetical protein
LAWFERTPFLHPRIGLLLDDVTTRSGDGCRHPAPMLQVLVGGVDDGVDSLLSEVALDYLDHP